MDDNILAKEKEFQDFWEKIEKIIKSRESIILLFIIIGSFVFIPFKILSYGWTPADDAKRHVAFAMTDSKWSDIVVVDERYTDHSAGWHQILRFLHKKCGFDKQDLMFFSVAGLFILLNIFGIIVSPSPISWCLALLIFANIDSCYFRLLGGRPYMVSYTVILIILHLWSFNTSNLGYQKPLVFDKEWKKYALTLLLFSLGVWIHGSWYLYFIIPVTFLIAGKTKDSIKLACIILISIVIGAFLTGEFSKFIAFHSTIALNIFSEPIDNSLLVGEFRSGYQSSNFAIAIALIIIFCMKKTNYKLKDLSNDPVFILILLSWMFSIKIIRFWFDFGMVALLLWLSYRIHSLIETSSSLKKPRVRYCLSIFIIVSLILCFINDQNGRYTKPGNVNHHIDFYNKDIMNKLKGWEPQDGGIVYSNLMFCFYQHFYEYPTAKWRYVLGFEPAIMKSDDKQVFRNIRSSGLEQDYAPWVNKMTEKDRLILNYKLTTYPQLEWIQGSRNWWIGRLKERK